MKNISRISFPLLLVCGTIALILPWLFFGFHYWDIGWNATKAWLIVTHPSEAFWEFSWLSSLVGGLWMKLTHYSLIWLRIGYVVSTVATVLIAHAILWLYYDPKQSALALIPALLLFITGFEQFIPNYYTVPPLFGLMAIYFYLKSYKFTARADILRLSIFCGICFAFLVQARIPALTLGLIFPISAIIERSKSGTSRVYIVRLLAVGCGIIVGTGILALLLYWSGNLGNAMSGLRQTYIDVTSYHGEDNIHHPLRLLWDTLVRYIKMVAIGGVALSGAYIWKKWFPRREPNGKDVFTIVLMLAVVMLTILFVARGWGSFPPSFGILIMLFGAIVIRQRRQLSQEKMILYMTAILYLFTMNLGSSNPGVGSLKYTAWLFAPIALIESAQLSSSTISYPLLRLLFIFNLATLMLTSRILQDYPIFQMTEAFRTEALQSIYYTAEGVAEFEEVTEEMKEAGMRPGDTTLFYIDIPLLHFTTQTIPALRNPWISDRSVGLPSAITTRTILEQETRTGHLPKFIVRAHGIYNQVENDIPKIRFLDSLWGAERYDTVRQSKRFIILRRPNY